MAALSITAASVAYVSGPLATDQVAGEAFIAGAYVYKSSTGTWLKAQCDGTATEAGLYGLGMALATADAAGARISVALPGAEVTINAVATAGITYLVHATAGSIGLVSDVVTSTNKVSIAALGVATTRLLIVGVYNAGSVIA